jgi:hypothetical protein
LFAIDLAEITFSAAEFGSGFVEYSLIYFHDLGIVKIIRTALNQGIPFVIKFEIIFRTIGFGSVINE